MFCPTCRAEYRPGFARCGECDVALVPELPIAGDESVVTPSEADTVTAFYSEDPRQVLAAKTKLEASGIPCTESENDGRPGASPTQISVARWDSARADRALADIPGYREWRATWEREAQALEEGGEALQICPKCALISPASARRCECGVQLVPPEEPADEGAAPTASQAGPPLRGLDGVLLLVATGVVIAPVVTGYALVDFLRVWQRGGWSRELTPGTSSYHPLWQPYLLGWAVTMTVLCGWALVLVSLFFGKRQSFPRAAIQFLFLGAALLATSLAVRLKISGAAPFETNEINALFIAGLVTLMTIFYLHVSRWVRDTFVE